VLTTNTEITQTFPSVFKDEEPKEFYHNAVFVLRGTPLVVFEGMSMGGMAHSTSCGVLRLVFYLVYAEMKSFSDVTLKALEWGERFHHVFTQDSELLNLVSLITLEEVNGDWIRGEDNVATDMIGIELTFAFTSQVFRDG